MKDIHMNEWYNIFRYKYADFNSRATRKEFWSFSIINFFIMLILLLLSPLYGSGVVASILKFIPIVFAIFAFIPNLAAISRRLHDTGRSAAWILLILLGFGVLV